jgi:hypothetical protein
VSWRFFAGAVLATLSVMSILRPGDDRLHYSDNSHRWIAPGNVDQKIWDAGVRAHLLQHLATMGGPGEADRGTMAWVATKPPPRMRAASPKKTLPPGVNRNPVASRTH